MKIYRKDFSFLGSHAIYTIDELNERISNLHSSMSDFYNKGQSLAIDEDDEDSQNELNELRKNHQDSGECTHTSEKNIIYVFLSLL